MKYIFQKSKSREDGFTLIEVVVALAIMGIIAVGLFSALGTSFIGTGVADERATAKNLAESQMEYVKKLPWNPAGDYSIYQEGIDEISSEYPGYSATIDPATFPHDDGDDLTDEDLNVQKITITVFHHGEEVLQLKGYKLR